MRTRVKEALMAATAVDTKKADRRGVEIESVEDLLADLDRLESAEGAGTLRTTGNWSAGQVLQHCARTWAAAIDGFPAEMRPPWWLKAGARLMFKKRAVAGETAPPGIKLPPEAAAILPEEGVTFAEGLGELRAQIGRTQGGERFNQPSPIFGKMTHEEWQKLQLGHCRLHLGFLHPGG